MEQPTPSGPWHDIPDSYWRAYFGKEAGYYMFQLEQLRNGRTPAFHFPAMFLGFLWMVYRRMFVVAIAAFILTILLGSILGVVMLFTDVNETVVELLDKILNFGSAIAVGVFANRVYLWDARRTIRDEMEKGISQVDEVMLERIAARGGTSWPSVIALIVLGVALIGLAAAFVDMTGVF